MTNREIKKTLEMALGVCEWAKNTQNNQNSIGNDIILEQQQKNIDKLKKFIESIPEDKLVEYKICWIHWLP
jgi:hypothetical protein